MKRELQVVYVTTVLSNIRPSSLHMNRGAFRRRVSLISDWHNVLHSSKSICWAMLWSWLHFNINPVNTIIMALTISKTVINTSLLLIIFINPHFGANYREAVTKGMFFFLLLLPSEKDEHWCLAACGGAVRCCIYRQTLWPDDHCLTVIDNHFSERISALAQNVLGLLQPLS